MYQRESLREEAKQLIALMGRVRNHGYESPPSGPPLGGHESFGQNIPAGGSASRGSGRTQQPPGDNAPMQRTPGRSRLGRDEPTRGPAAQSRAAPPGGGGARAGPSRQRPAPKAAVSGEAASAGPAQAEPFQAGASQPGTARGVLAQARAAQASPSEIGSAYLGTARAAAARSGAPERSTGHTGPEQAGLSPAGGAHAGQAQSARAGPAPAGGAQARRSQGTGARPSPAVSATRQLMPEEMTRIRATWAALSAQERARARLQARQLLAGSRRATLEGVAELPRNHALMATPTVPSPGVDDDIPDEMKADLIEWLQFGDVASGA